MSKGKEKIDPRQMTLEDLIDRINRDNLPPAPARDDCDIGAQLRGILNEAIRESKLSRDQIAEEMTLLLGVKISTDQINTWTRAAAPRHIPLEYIYAFESAANSSAITEYLCKLHGGRFVDRQVDDALSLGQIQMLKIDLAGRERELKRRISR